MLIRHLLIFVSIIMLKPVFIFGNKQELFLMEAKDKNGGLAKQFLKKLAEIFKANVFIETGTFLGHTAGKASEYFDNVHTIELNKKLFKKSRRFLKKYKNVTVHFGDSSKILDKIIADIEGRIVFWLDGHYSGNHDGCQTALGECNPLLTELVKIKNSKHKDAIILVDDIRLCDEIVVNLNDPIVGGYPKINEICCKILEINNNYKFVIFGDILLAYPNDPNIIISLILQACTHSRFYDNDNIDSNFILEMEKIISKANGEEKIAFETLNNTFGSDLHAIKYNVGRHYILWYALLMMDEKNFEKAYERLNHIKSLGFKHWRIYWYMAQAAYGMKKIELGNWHAAQVTYKLKKNDIGSELIKKLSEQIPDNLIKRSIINYEIFDQSKKHN